MIKKIGHIGVMVKDLEASLNQLCQILDLDPPEIKDVPKAKMKYTILDMGGCQLEMVEDYSGDGPVARQVSEKGDHIHHFCFLVDNLPSAVDWLNKRGIEEIEEPRTGLRGKQIAFFDPNLFGGLRIELSEP